MQVDVNKLKEWLDDTITESNGSAADFDKGIMWTCKQIKRAIERGSFNPDTETKEEER